MMETLFAGVAVLFLAVWTALPLIEPRRDESPPANRRLDDLVESKQAIYRSILDLELDHQVGKVSDGDYALLRRQHEREALAILKELDQAAASDQIADVLEAEIAAARERLRKG